MGALPTELPRVFKKEVFTPPNLSKQTYDWTSHIFLTASLSFIVSRDGNSIKIGTPFVFILCKYNTIF